jgi:hypothetical protein
MNRSQQIRATGELAGDVLGGVVDTARHPLGRSRAGDWIKIR